MELQVAVSQWIGGIADYLSLGYAFGAGMVSAVNPCGFFMLPVYMTLYLGADDGEYHALHPLRRVLKAVWVTVVVSAGFGLLFALMGAVVSVGGYYLMAAMPWFAVVVGGGLVVLGLWLLMGKNLSMPLAIRLANRIGDLRAMHSWGFFVFGLVFGATSLGCTLPIFLAVIGSSITSGNFLAGFLDFLSYTMGMGTVLLALTLSIALVKKRLVIGTMRRISRHVTKLSALFLLAAGGYIIYYWLSSGLLFGP